MQNRTRGSKPQTNRYRENLYDRIARRFNERTRVGGIDAACEFSQRMLDNLKRAVEHSTMTP